MHWIVTTFRRAVIKVEVANFCAAMDTLIDQDENIQDVEINSYTAVPPKGSSVTLVCSSCCIQSLVSPSSVCRKKVLNRVSIR